MDGDTSPGKFHPDHAARLDDPRRREWMPVEPLVEALGLREGDRVVDLGCGTGYWLRALLQDAPPRTAFTGADSEPAMLQMLRQRLPDHPRGRDVAVVRSGEHAVPLPDGSQDVAVMGSVYHELLDRAGYLREVLRLLAPGGRFALIDWDVLPEGAERTFGPPPAERIPADTARRELLEAGFADVARIDGFVQSYCLLARKPG